jgi:ABC-type iron transport system FetAB permease component
MKTIALEENLELQTAVSGREELKILSVHVLLARSLLRTARTADEVRMAQAILLPADFKFSIEQTARAMARSCEAVVVMIEHFIANYPTQTGPLPLAKLAAGDTRINTPAAQDKVTEKVTEQLLSEIITPVAPECSAAAEASKPHAKAAASAAAQLATPATKYYGLVLQSLRAQVYPSLTGTKRYKKIPAMAQA